MMILCVCRLYGEEKSKEACLLKQHLQKEKLVKFDSLDGNVLTLSLFRLMRSSPSR